MNVNETTPNSFHLYNLLIYSLYFIEELAIYWLKFYTANILSSSMFFVLQSYIVYYYIIKSQIRK